MSSKGVSDHVYSSQLPSRFPPQKAVVEVHHHFDSEHGLDSDEQHYEFHLTSCVIKINNQNRLYDGMKDKKDMMKMERIIMRRQRFIETRNKSGSITATPGWKIRQNFFKELNRTMSLHDHNCPMATRKQS